MATALDRALTIASDTIFLQIERSTVVVKRRAGSKSLRAAIQAILAKDPNTRTFCILSFSVLTPVNIVLINCLKNFYVFCCNVCNPLLVCLPFHEFPLRSPFRACPKGTGRLPAVRIGIARQTWTLFELSAFSRPA